MIAFINPIRNLSKSVLDSDVSKQQKDDLFPLIRIGIKVAILFMGVATVGLTVLGPIAQIVNMICIILITRYYNEQIQIYLFVY